MTTQQSELNEEIRRSIIALKNTIQGATYMTDTSLSLRTHMKDALQRYQAMSTLVGNMTHPVEVNYLARSGVRLLSDHGWLLTEPQDSSDCQYWLTVKAKLLIAKDDQQPARQVLIDEVHKGSREFDQISLQLLGFMQKDILQQVLQDLL